MKEEMLQGSYQAVLEVRTRDEFLSEVVRFTKQLGFETVAAVTFVDRPLGDTEVVSVENTPEAFLDSYLDGDEALLDPVMQHCKRNNVPIVWDQKTYVTAGRAGLWESQAQFGYRTGIALALHMPEGRHFVIGVDRDQSLPSHQGEVTRMVADLQLFAVYAQDTAMRVLVPERLQPERPKLTPRELEALRWTMEGKTAWELGTILGISERTAVLHVNNAMHKLGCVNKHQAVLKALRLGLLR
jgi:DNA-binding CsgD family transcriptional regulator